MSKKELKHKELLSTQMNAGESQDKVNSSKDNPKDNTELIRRESIKDTPFYVIGNEEKGYFLALGRHRVTDVKETVEEAKELLVTEQWNIITRIVTVIYETLKDMEIKNEALERENLSTIE